MSVSLSALLFHVVLVAFEGPDRYSFVGGLATRMNDLAAALVARGHRVHHLFVGDPKLPFLEEREGGRLVLERWSQWISAYHLRDVYDGEEGKYFDFSRTVPPHLADFVVAPAAARGERSVLLFEDWQTAAAAIGTATYLQARGLQSAAIFWNANNTYGFGRVDFPMLRRAASITTISRYMRMELAKVDVEAAILPNAIAAMRDAGVRPRLIMRGSRSPYADTVGDRIRARALSVDRIALGADATPADLAAAIATTQADVVFLDFFVAERTLRALYAAADGVLANSEKEPFGLVGLEVMACGGIAYLGRTGEDYAVPFGNSIVIQSDDPRELATAYGTLRERRELVTVIRAEGRATAKRFAWPRILDAYESAWETAFALTR